MIFKDREQLCIIEVKLEDNNKVTFEKLAKILIDNPSNMVYCVNDGKLYGIISMGDVHRAKEKNNSSVDINTSFTFLHRYEYMSARKIFLENDKINALPIVDEKYKLLGDYSRWNDDFLNYSFDFLKGNKYTDIVLKKYRKVAIVYPSKQTQKMMVNVWKDFFQTYNIEVEIIQKYDIVKAFADNEILFFADEDEIRGLGTLYKDILDMNFEWRQAKTLEAVGEAVREAVREAVGETVGEAVLRDFIHSGVHIMTLQNIQSSDIYWKRIKREINTKWANISKKPGHYVPKEFWEDFYDDIYSYEYASEVSKWSYVHIKEGYMQKLKDIESKYYNVNKGERVTANQPAEFDKTIYFFGPCLMVGTYCEDRHTIESFLQKTLNENGYKVKVVNCGCWSNEVLLLFRMFKTKLKKGDIAIVYDKNKCFTRIPNLNLGKVVESNNVSSKWFLDDIIHTNYKGNEMYASAIYDALPKKILKEKASDEIIKVKNPIYAFASAYIEKYFDNKKMRGVIGSIVMNCNPFTYGHMFLIEEACKKVDKLIIFVVEEDMSLFSFEERFAMVIEGTKHINNVVVVPSGDFILSQQTFPEYFIKIEDKDVSHNAEFDIKLFAKIIAPRLNIKYRFVGEEKMDVVTAEYNNAMKRILPRYGIEVVEIPRKSKVDGSAICATEVRDLLGVWKIEEVRKLVPQTTFDILMKS